MFTRQNFEKFNIVRGDAEILYYFTKHVYFTVGLQ